MPEFIRVKAKDTGHEFTIREDKFNEDAHAKVNKPALGVDGLPLPPKPKTTVAKSAAAKQDESGQAADPKKEN